MNSTPQKWMIVSAAPMMAWFLFGAMPKGRYFLVREFWLRQAVQTCFAGLMVRAWRKRRNRGAAEIFRRI
jgi:hypothetical protein